MVTNVEDNNDGTYLLSWRSKFSGTFKTRVTIENLDVIGSPRTFSLTSSTPELSKSELYGDGLKAAVSGKHATFKVKFVDTFGNTAIPGEEYKFFMSMQRDKEKLSNVKTYEYEGAWEPDDTGVLEMKYSPSVAGGCEMHVWAEIASRSERFALPGSPFYVVVSPGKASAAVSCVDVNPTKLVKDDKNEKQGKVIGDTSSGFFAGDTACFRPQIFDINGNAAHLPEGALKVIHRLPNGTESELSLTQQVKSGQVTYDVRTETTLSGPHRVHFLLFGADIVGSPVKFIVSPDRAEPANSFLKLPEQEKLYTEDPYAVVLKTFDRFGNTCDRGGLMLNVRLQLMKQGVHDQTTLVQGSNHQYEVEDRQNGEYYINMNFQIPCTFKLNVNMDKNLPSGGGELPPMTISIYQNPDIPPADLVAAPPAGAKGGRKTSLPTSSALKDAAKEIMKGFGAQNERREKDVLLVAAEAFAEGAKKFEFDRNDATESAEETNPVASIPVQAEETLSNPPSPTLFDKEPAVNPSSPRARRADSSEKKKQRRLSLP